MDEKLVSIIISSYNHEKFVEDCLESVKAQTYKNIELIIADDCSSDDTFLIIKKWLDSNKDRFVRTELNVNEENLGITKSCNRLLKKCNGFYIKNLASDDILDKNCIKSMVDFMECNSCFDLAFSNGYIISDRTNYPVVPQDIINEYYSRPVRTDGNFFERLYCTNRICAPMVLFKKSTFELFGYYDEGIAFEDWEYWLRVAKDGNIGYTDEHTVYYRLNSQSASHFARDKEKFRRFIREENKILERYSQYTNVGKAFWQYTVLRRALVYNDYEFLYILKKEGIITISGIIKGVIMRAKEKFEDSFYFKIQTIRGKTKCK